VPWICDVSLAGITGSNSGSGNACLTGVRVVCFNCVPCEALVLRL
jgi:hypothetical protein